VAKQDNLYVCQQCGSVQPKWSGRCEACGGWNTLVEETNPGSVPKGLDRKSKSTPLDLVSLEGNAPPLPRYLSEITEFDRVCGGGLVPGSVILVGGDPGIGKSTILLQVTAALSKSISCLYISGEEGIEQIRMRANRLDLQKSPVELASATNLRTIITTLEGAHMPQFVVIDSIQTMYIDALESAPGTVAQVRACSQELIRVAKRKNLVVVLVGHVTKEGTLAGPRVLEHMVDTVLYFEGERSHQFRILRAVKNRFGATDEIGVFEMSEKGLQEVTNPSALFLADRREDVNGAAVFAGIEGTRPVLVEIQSLVAPSSLATPRRTVVGWDTGRLAMVIAVLEARCGISFAGKDVYLNVAGGLRIGEPAADLAVASALISSLSGKPLPEATVIFGELGLSGEIRAVSQTPARLKEAFKLGFSRAFLPASKQPVANPGLKLYELQHINDLIDYIGRPESSS
jgi:DNA repair protein RadA/Sms